MAEQVEAGYSIENLICTGLRGMGKTVLLKEYLRRLRDRGWLCGYFEVRRDAQPGQVVGDIISDGARLAPRRSRIARFLRDLRAQIGGVTLSTGADGALSVAVSPQEATGADPHEDLAKLLVDLGRAARDDGCGVALLVDELQQFRRRDLSVLIQASRRVDELPVALIGAGLPYLPAELGRASTYAERFRYEPVDRLPPGEARRAVTEPAGDFQVSFDPKALWTILDLAEGFPYFLQLYASEAWRAAGTPSERPGTTIGARHVDAAVPQVQRQLDAGLYAARYDRATGAERDYLHAMVSVMDNHPGADRVASGEVARTLGKVITSVGPTRDRLIKKGLVHSPASGFLEFSVPGFDDYVRRRRDAPE